MHEIAKCAGSPKTRDHQKRVTTKSHHSAGSPKERECQKRGIEKRGIVKRAGLQKLRDCRKCGIAESVGSPKVRIVKRAESSKERDS